MPTSTHKKSHSLTRSTHALRPENAGYGVADSAPVPPSSPRRPKTKVKVYQTIPKDINGAGKNLSEYRAWINNTLLRKKVHDERSSLVRYQNESGGIGWLRELPDIGAMTEVDHIVDCLLYTSPSPRD